jgi:hypothetical protein
MGIDLAPYFPASWLKIGGEDAAEYLQGQVSNDLRRMGPRGIYTLILDHKGKIQADAFITRDGGEFWVGSVFVPPSVLRNRLEAFVVADDVTVEDRTGAFAGIAVLGAGAGSLVDRARQEMGLPGFALDGRRCAEENVEWIVPADRREAALEWLRKQAPGPTSILDEAELRRRRIRDGRVAVPADAGPGDLPQEAGLGEDAVSYQKGCYIGQEVMARLKTRGRVRRRLRRVRGAGVPPPAGTAVFLGARRAGETRSAAEDGGGFMAWAMIAGDAPTEGGLRLGAEGRAELALVAD